MNARKLLPSDTGCWIDGHWGHYGTARVIDIAREFGWQDTQAIDIAERKLASMMPSPAPDISDDESDILPNAADDAESWLNEHVAPRGYSFGWHDGEFFLQSKEWWQV